jgi:hypothetical protein
MVINNFIYSLDYMEENNIKKLSPILKSYFKDVHDLFKLFYDILFSKKLSQLHLLSEKRKELIDRKLKEHLANSEADDRMILHYMAEVVRLVSSNGGLVFIILTDTAEE